MAESAADKNPTRSTKADAKLADAAAESLAAIQAMDEPDRSLAARVHAIVVATAPGLAPRVWYGMPAWARDGKVVCFFQSGLKYKTRYCTLGFQDAAMLDDGAMWPSAFAITSVGEAEEARIAALVKRAVG